MIHIDRSRVRLNAIERKSLQRLATERRKFFESTSEDRKQLRAPAVSYHGLEPMFVRFIQLFFEKCAFTEQPLPFKHLMRTPARKFYTTFRPTDGAMDLEGVDSPDHYWWLAYDWDNLYLAHPSVISQKQGLFPVIGECAPVNASIARCRKERALLLDPCFDQPTNYLVFGEDGQVHPAEPLTASLLNPYGKHHRGRISIDVYGLNERNLVASRKRLAASYTRLLGAFDPSSGLMAEIHKPLGREVVFAGMHRQLFARFIRGEYLASRSPRIRRELLNHAEAVQIESAAILSRQRRSKRRQPAPM